MLHSVHIITVLLLLPLTLPSSLGRKYGTTLDKEVREILIELLELELEDGSKELKFTDDDKVKNVDGWLVKVNEDLRVWRNKASTAEWNYATNITDYNRQQLGDVEAAFSAWLSTAREKASSLRTINKGLLDFTTDRQLRLLSKYADPSNPEDVRRLKDLEGRMSGIYSTARACKNRETCLQIEPGLQDIMATSRKPEELEWAWKTWRNVTGPVIKPLYLKFVQLHNEGATDNKYADYGAYWRDDQFDQTPNLEAICDTLWTEVKPMYVQLHAYVRKKLREFYGDKVVGTGGAIPAHLLGNMWAQNWQMIADIVFPPANGNTNDISKTAEKNLKENYDVHKLFQLAEEFYESIGMYSMTDIFWKKSMLMKPDEREVTCHASASDLFAPDDVRIKMCSEVSMDYLYTVHHEMGHIEYFMAYSNLPTIYRAGANGAFHEAVGDTMTLSVVTRKHLETIKLIPQGASSKDDDIADLLNMALFKVAFLPYGFMLDKWRWRVFSEDIPEERLNKEYWELRLKYQGIVSPVPRSEADFDPAAKYHVPANSPYMIYFISFIAQFQFYKSMCVASGHEGPLHKCDFFHSKHAGEKLRNMLELGQSIPWPDALENVTGSRDISVEPLLEYFQPLMAWLEEQNKGENPGWDDAEINWQK